MPRVTAYHHVSLSVTDLARSTGWYRETLGLQVVAEIEGSGFRRHRLRPAGGGVTLTLTAHDVGSTPASVGTFDERRPGLDHVAFQVAGHDIGALKQRFERLSVEHSEIKESSSGTAMITLRDPDNIQIEVFGGPG